MTESDFLEYYNRELNYIRESGKEFAEQYPKVAGRLGMQGIEVEDPYVERLLEGFSYLTARIHMKMDAEFPQFTHNLLEVLHPHFVAPTPSMSIKQFQLFEKPSSLEKGFTIPRRSNLSTKINGFSTIEFTTGQDLTLWPVQLEEAEITGVPVDLPLKRMGFNDRNRPQVLSALRMRFSLHGKVSINDLEGFDSLSFFLHGHDHITHQLLELIMGHSLAVICHDGERPMRWINRLPKEVIHHEGFEPGQSLLPVDPRVFQGYRILHEYFAFPQRFLFFSINDLSRGLKISSPQSKDEKFQSFELVFLFDQAYPDLEANVNADNFQMNCVPAINLFSFPQFRVKVEPNLHQYHIVPQSSSPMDYEVYSVDAVEGLKSGSIESQPFKSMYNALSLDKGDHIGYYSTRREPRQMSDMAKRKGTRTSYLGSEVFLNLADPLEPPFDTTINELNVQLTCTNRDLPLLLSAGEEISYLFSGFAPVRRVISLRGPTKPRPAIARGSYAWRLISHLNLNYASLMDLDEEQGAAALRELLRIYADVADGGIEKQINGIRKVSIKAMNSRLPLPGPIVYGRGVRISVEVDELSFSGISPYLFGAVLHQFFARHVSINLMAELVLSSLQRGKIAHWKPRMGARPVV